MEKYQLLYFFWELLKLADKHHDNFWGNACSHLLETMCLTQENFIGSILGDYSNESHEYRLNGAGLKLYWMVDRQDQTQSTRFKCRVGGDQRADYLFFTQAANDMIAERGYTK